MTAPTEPAPVAPEGTPAPPPAPPAPAPFDVNALPPEVQAYIKSQVDAADLKARTGSKANAAAEARKELTAQIATALGLAGDEPPDPAALTAHLEAARDAAWASGVELQVFRIAGPLGANPDSLLDSRAFIASLDDLVDLDPNSAEFRTALQAKVQEAAAKHPATTPASGQAPSGLRPDPSQGPRGTPPAPRPTSLTQAYRAHYETKRAGR
ncbi:MAG: hypothetical protein V4515_13660 [Chloroflexota bacterium]